jgi:molybdate transport system substrate-binding protein
MKRRPFLAAALAGLAPRLSHADADDARVAAASDLQFALPELAAAYERASGRHVALSFGSSGNLARQLEQGAPMDLFLSADESFVHRLAEARLTRDAGALYAVGRVACLVPSASTLPLDEKLDGLRRGLPQIRRFALANPEHAPYGRAAREALQRLDLWDAVQPMLVLGENISQATQYVASGAAQAGMTSLSLALAPPVAARTRHVVLPETLHAPLRQRMALMKNARPAAAVFYEYLQSPAARALLARHGFAVPDALR